MSDDFEDPTGPEIDDDTVRLQTFYPNGVSWVHDWLLPR
jgi:hypothetical protein